MGSTSDKRCPLFPMSLDRFAPPSASDEQYTCTRCGEQSAYMDQWTDDGDELLCKNCSRDVAERRHAKRLASLERQ